MRNYIIIIILFVIASSCLSINNNKRFIAYDINVEDYSLTGPVYYHFEKPPNINKLNQIIDPHNNSIKAILVLKNNIKKKNPRKLLDNNGEGYVLFNLHFLNKYNILINPVEYLDSINISEDRKQVIMKNSSKNHFLLLKKYSK